MKLAVLGSKGKMGQNILAEAKHDPFFTIIGSPGREGPFGPLFEEADLIVDFTSADATLQFLPLIEKYKKPFILGTTGIPPETNALIKKIANKTPILQSPNFSIGIALLSKALSDLSPHFPENYNARIKEIHHSHKKDAPSGTALALSKTISISEPIESIREGMVVGDHTIVIEWEGERLEFRHEALSRSIFAKGVLSAAKKLVKMPPGLYELKDLFFL